MQATSRRLALLSAVLPFSALAQTDRGLITGTVKDSSGAVVQNASITATQTKTNLTFKSVTTNSGDYTIPSLPVGEYSVRIEATGFKSVNNTGIVVTASGTLRVDAALEVGTQTQTVDVAASAFQIQTENAKIQTQVANKLVDELPLVVGGQLRSPFDLAQLAPEVKATGNADTTFAIGGGQAASWGMTLDGTTVTTGRALQTVWAALNTPSLDAIDEFTVDTNGFKAEYGRAQGGMMSFVSKSGTNQFHGNAYEFLRNEALDARFFYSPRVPLLRQHDFGGTFGGPVWIPKIYSGKNKTFFFFSYEAFRNREGANPSFLSVAPREFYQGDFRNWVDASNRQIPVYDPATQRVQNGVTVRDPFANNQVPQARFDGIAQRMLEIGQTALPNTGAAPGTSAYVRNNFLQAGAFVRPWNKMSIRGDHQINSAHRLSGYYFRADRAQEGAAQGPPGLPGFLNGQNLNNTQSDGGRFSWDWVVSPTKFNRFYAGGNYWREINRAIAVGARNWRDVVCLPNVPDCNNNLLSVGFQDFTTWGGPSDNGSENHSFAFNNDFTWIRGKHNFKMGGMYEMVHYNGFGQQNIMGFVAHGRRATGVPGDLNQATGGGSSFASFLLGLAENGNIHTPRYIPQRYPYWGFFFQDDYRVNSKLSLSYGLRYDLNVSPFSAWDNFSDFDPTRPNPGADNRPGALRFAGFGEGREGRRRLVDNWWGGWGPRFGFAYSLGDKTVLRGSFARTFAVVRAVTGSAHFQGFVQILDFPTPDQGFSPSFRLAQGLPDWPRPPFINPAVQNGQGVHWWQGNEVSRAPENLTYNLSIQRQVSKDTVLELGWNAVRGNALQAGLLNYNQLNLAGLPANLSPFTAEGRALLNSNINSPAAQAAGIRAPYSNFVRDFTTRATVGQALRPFPQYSDIDTAAGGNGDRSGRSIYHAAIVKLEKRFSGGLTFLSSYVFSKILTDADSAWVGGRAMDHYNRQLDYSIGQFDQTHNFKLSYVYEVPFGKGRKFLNQGGVVDAVFGGWRIGMVHLYASGLPMGLGTTVGFPIFNGGNRPTISTYEGWRRPIQGSEFDPSVDRFVQPASFFGVQPTDRFGNMTRYNPRFRELPILNENMSLAKSFRLTERFRLDLRAEAFNLFNRQRWGAAGGALTIQNENLGLWNNQVNDPRRMQLALKLYF